MKNLIVFLTTIILISACSPAAEISRTATSTPEISNNNSTITATKTASSELEEHEITNFQVMVGDLTCNIKPIPIDGNYYIAECDENVILPINQAVTVKLIPPDDNEYVLLELFERLELVEILFHDALIAYFRDGTILNQTDFVIPFSNVSDVDVILGFSIELNQLATILIKGKAIR